MPNPDREPQHSNDPGETRLQADPVLRPGRVPWSWPIAIGTAILAIAAVLFAASYDRTEVADDEVSETAVTRSRAPSAPTNRGVRNTPAERGPLERTTTGSGR